MEVPFELRPPAARRRQWFRNSAHGSSEQYNGDYHNNQRHYYVFTCCCFGAGDKRPFAELWTRFKRWFGASHPWSTFGAVFLVLAILVASIVPPLYHAIDNACANTTVVYSNNVLSTCNRYGKTICTNNSCDTTPVCIIEKTLTVPCWPDWKCCTAACLESRTCNEDGK